MPQLGSRVFGKTSGRAETLSRNETMRKVPLTLVAILAASSAWADLTLEDALRSARANNGTVQAAYLNYRAAVAQERASYAAFLPTVTPTVRQENGRLNNFTGLGRGGSTIDATEAGVTASWLILDNGTRATNYRSAGLVRDQAEFSALDTLRNVLFNVHLSFYNALRAQELLIVQTSGVRRAKEILDRAILSEEVGAGPKKDILQARADYLNAQVGELTAQNQVSTSRSSLWAVIGYSEPEIPKLVGPGEQDPQLSLPTLEEATEQALRDRADLRAARIGIESSEAAVDTARLAGSFSYSLSAQYNRSFSESVFDRSGIVLEASFPLYDGSRSKERVTGAKLDLESRRKSYDQSVRVAIAEIESAWKEQSQNAERIRASRIARDAALLNYEAATEARRLGAGELIEELTARLSLVTAESNLVQAVYDYWISDVRFRLASGRPLPGEESEEETP